MKKIALLTWVFLALLSPTLISCTDEDDAIVEEPSRTGIDPDEIPDVEGLEFLNPSLVYDGYILVNDASANRVYLMDKTTQVVFEWNLNGKRLGNDAHLLPNGKLLAVLESDNPKINIGGFGGLLAIIDKDGAYDWSYEYSTDTEIAHHDAEMLPNGNVLFMAWIKKTPEEAAEIGFSEQSEIIYDALIEINPTTNEIVWEWHMWDHLIQDFDATKNNFGVVSEHPELIDVNYTIGIETVSDVSHGNGIAYDADNDLIYLSANFYSEIWVIDHSTSTEEAALDSGGNFGQGGNLVYRFGNPDAYDNIKGQRRFDRNHFPNLLNGEKNGNILVFSNGIGVEQSTAYELMLPSPLALQADTDNEPDEIWSYTNENLFSGKVSGVDLLPNGNRLITEGDFGFWEVTEQGEIIWRYQTQGFFWRGYHFEKDAPEVLSIGI